MLVVGLECNYAYFNNDSIEEVKIEWVSAYCYGYDIQVAIYIANRLDMELQLRKIEWNGLIPALLSKEIDVIIAGMSPTPKKVTTVSFTNEYYHSELVFVIAHNLFIAVQQS